LIAVVETVLRFGQSVYAPFYALFIVGPIANSIEIWMDSRRHAITAAVAQPGA